jgi:two-component system, chemotaxis family, protein-glutamate methylesterase/glutaminase
MEPSGSSMPKAVVAVVASAGGVDAIRAFVMALPADFPAAVLVVLHVSPAGPSVLPSILSRASRLPAIHPGDGEKLCAGVIYVAPPDRHMAVTGPQVRVFIGPRENGHRPAGDVLFRSVAEDFGPRSAGVVLSGTMDDGAAGLRAVGAAGGLTLVQDPAEAAFPGMPLAAIHEAGPRVVGQITELTERLREWVSELPQVPEDGALQGDPDPVNGSDPDLTAFTCPECGGTLWQRDEYAARRFRCRVGHSFSPDALMLGKQHALEAALWAAIVALEERSDLSRRMMERIEESGRPRQIERYRTEIVESTKRARMLRELINDLVQDVTISHAEGMNGDPAS